MIDIRKITTILALLSFFFSLFYRENELYRNIYFLPFALLIFNLIFSTSLKPLKNSIVFNLIFFQIIIRYILMPILIATGNEFMAGFNSSSSNEAILIMIIELLFIYLAFLFISVKYFRQKAEVSYKILFLKLTPLIAAILLISVIIIFSTGFLSKVNFIWDFSTFVRKVQLEEVEETNSFAGLLYPRIKIILALIIISAIYVSKLRNSIKLSLMFITIVANSIFITGVSRFSVIFSMAPLIIITLLLYPKYKVKFGISLLFLIIPIIIISSIGKFSSEDNKAEIMDVFNANAINAYFSGVGNVSAGIDSYYKLNGSNHLEFMFNDLFQNVPILSRLTGDFTKSNINFNKEIYNHTYYQTQIVPLSVAGLYHFGIYGVPIYSVLFIFLAFHFERLYYKTSYLGLKYSYIFIALSASLIFMLNVGSMFSSFIINILLTAFPLFILHKTQKK